MKYVKYGIIVLFISSLVIYIGNWYKEKSNIDNTGPKIIISEKEMQIDVSVTDKKSLLRGIVAKDSNNQDITDKIIIESISKFVDKKQHMSNITYAVADSAGHVAKATRKVRFTDYKKPRFVLKQPLYFDTGSDVKAKDVIGATDLFDGDISNKVKIVSRDISTNESGDGTITAQVTNSFGDTVTLKTVVIIKRENNLSPVIKLKKNIEYIKVGAKFDAEKYVESVTDSNGKKMSNSSVQVTSSSVKTSKAGCYIVEYAARDTKGQEGLAYLTVMVEE